MFLRQDKSLVRIGLLLALLAAGCSAQRARNNQLLKEWSAKCREAADLLKTVHDVPSAKAAAPKLKAAMEELHRLEELLDQTDDPEDVNVLGQSTAIEHVAQGIAEMQRLMEESVRIGKSRELREALGETWDLLPAAAMVDESGNPIQGG